MNRFCPQSYIDKNAGWDIIHIIGKYFNQLVRDRITAVFPFSRIMVDETTDISITTQLIVKIKYLGKSNDNQDDQENMNQRVNILIWLFLKVQVQLISKYSYNPIALLI